MGTALKDSDVHSRIKELNDEGWMVGFSSHAHGYSCALQRGEARTYGTGGNPLSALFEAEANLKEPVSKAMRDVVGN